MGIEPIREVLAPRNGFEDREAHQLPFYLHAVADSIPDTRAVYKKKSFRQTLGFVILRALARRIFPEQFLRFFAALRMTRVGGSKYLCSNHLPTHP